MSKSAIRESEEVLGLRLADLIERQTRRSQALRKTDAGERIGKLQRMRAAIERNAEAVYRALAADIGKPRAEAAGDYFAPLAEADMAIAHLENWMQPEPITTTSGAHAYIRHEPKGKVLIFGPWNYPFALTMQPLVAAVAAGNTSVVKPSELTPETSAIVAKIVAECFDEDEVAVIEGGPEVADALLGLPFDHIFFTGSTVIGKRVMAAAARHLATVTLELGGKCPVVVGDGADIQTTARAVVEGKFGNAGQVCVAPDHVWVPAHQLEPFAAAAANHIRERFYSSDELQGDRIANIINHRQVERLSRLLEEVVSQGAIIHQGGGISGLRFEPTLLTNVPRDSLIMQEEIFGPILPVLAYSDRRDVLAQLGRNGKPLAMYVFDTDERFIEAVLNETSSGGVTVNGVMLHAIEPLLLFGGVGASGMGAYHGRHSFRELTHRRSVYCAG